MNEIFVCYRRSDSADAAARLATVLQRSFGKQQVYLDVTGQEPGQSWKERIVTVLQACKSCVVVIGPQWRFPVSPAGDPEPPQAPSDIVHFEIRTALQRRVPVFPVLVDGAPVPDPNQVPEDIRRITEIQMHDISHEHYDRDVEDLTRLLARHVPTLRVRRLRYSLPGAVLLITGILVVTLTRPRPAPPPLRLPIVIHPNPPTSVVRSYRLLQSQVRIGDTIRIIVDAVSSRVRASAWFGEANGDSVEVQAGYDQQKGGVYLEYKVPKAWRLRQAPGESNRA